MAEANKIELLKNKIAELMVLPGDHSENANLLKVESKKYILNVYKMIFI